MPFVALVKETASRTSVEQALALTTPFDEWKVLNDNLTYFAETLEVSDLFCFLGGGGGSW